MTIVTWPTAKITGNKIADVREFFNTATAELADGSIVRPTLRTAKIVVDTAYLIGDMPMVVKADGYRS
jgi:hypothetical protein